MPDFPEVHKPRRYALITGASSGIGYELARCAAQDGYHLVLIGRSLESLVRVATEFETAYEVTVKAIAKDLAHPMAIEEIIAELQRESIPITLLINNAGFGAYGFFHEADVVVGQQMMDVNMVALTMLTRRLLPEMVRRKDRKILNVASTAAFQPGPLMAIYYATKAYVLSLSEALANELCCTGVTVTALCPGPTRTNFQQRAGMTATRLAGRGMMTVEAVARIGYAGLMSGKTVVIPGRRNRLLAMVVRWVPRQMAVRAVRWLQERRRTSL